MIDGSMASIRAQVSERLSTLELSARSRSALDRPLLHPAELLVAVPCDEALALGAHQRAREAPSELAFVRRGSGGAEARAWVRGRCGCSSRSPSRARWSRARRSAS